MNQKKLVGILLIVCLLSILPMQVAANTCWYEDFEDGNYDGWVVVDGTFDASSHYLEATQTGWNTIYNVSDVSCGQWIWDLGEDPVTEIDSHVFFIAIGYFAENISGYSVSVEYGTISNLTLYRWDDGESTILDQDTIPTDEVKSVNYNVSRDSSGYIQVVRISEVVLWDTDSTYTSCQDFMFHCENECVIDNITIVDCEYMAIHATTETTTTTTTTGDGDGITLLLLGGSIGVVIVVLIIFWRWRRP